MQEKEKGSLGWKQIGWSTVCAVAVYAGMALLGTALISGEAVGQERTGLLMGVFAAVAVAVSQLVFLRRVRSGRLGVCLLGGGLFVLSVVLVAVALGSWDAVVRGSWVLGIGAGIGSLATAALGGGKRRKRTARRR